MKMNTYTEHTDSQKPAIDLLRKMDYQYLSAEAVENERGEIRTHVLLENILSDQLAKINDFEYRDETYKFSQSSIQSAFEMRYFHYKSTTNKN